MKKIIPIATVVILAVVCIVWLWIQNGNLKEKLDESSGYKLLFNQSDSIISINQLKIDSLEQERALLIIKNDSLTRRIFVINNKYDEIKTDYAEKKDSVAGLNLVGLHGFFAGANK